jgi:hypothetical protein
MEYDSYAMSDSFPHARRTSNKSRGSSLSTAFCPWSHQFVWSFFIGLFLDWVRRLLTKKLSRYSNGFGQQPVKPCPPFSLKSKLALVIGMIKISFKSRSQNGGLQLKLIHNSPFSIHPL